jgi:phenylalanyl-tRNA synthetase beta chain
VCAYLSHHDGKIIHPKFPIADDFQNEASDLKISVHIEDNKACPRYSGLCFSNVIVQESPKWLQNKLRAINLRPINNIVDITNFIMHETGQPLHAFDYDAIKGGCIVVKKMPEGTEFETLDEKKRKLGVEDLMICNAEESICIAGVFGGVHSGVTAQTKNIFLESAFFDPVSIRKTSLRHGLRTDAATRFEKGIDISKTVTVLKRASQLIKEVAGGKVASDMIDIYPDPQDKIEITLTYAYLKKLSGKHYEPATIKNILSILEFKIITEGTEGISLQVPYHKRDVRLPADLVEEVMRIDGLDNIEIPSTITITPAVEPDHRPEAYKEKISQMLSGAGFSEILTNSITNSNYFIQDQNAVVKLVNNLSTELDALRPTFLYSVLETIAYNLNRKSHVLKFFEFGKIYKIQPNKGFKETAQLNIYITGNSGMPGWKEQPKSSDIYYMKGLAQAIFEILNIDISFSTSSADSHLLIAGIKNDTLAIIGKVENKVVQKFDIKQDVFFADFNWDIVLKYALNEKIVFRELSKYPTVERDLAMIVPSEMNYGLIEANIKNLKIPGLKGLKLFDVFESEKLGKDKKSIAVNFTFQDPEKTLTDRETDQWMTRIMNSLEKELNVEIRKQ